MQHALYTVGRECGSLQGTISSKYLHLLVVSSKESQQILREQSAACCEALTIGSPRNANLDCTLIAEMHAVHEQVPAFVRNIACS